MSRPSALMAQPQVISTTPAHQLIVIGGLYRGNGLVLDLVETLCADNQMSFLSEDYGLSDEISRFWGGNKPVPGEISTNFNKTAFWHDHVKETSKYAIKYRVTLLMR